MGAEFVDSGLTSELTAHGIQHNLIDPPTIYFSKPNFPSYSDDDSTVAYWNQVSFAIAGLPATFEHTFIVKDSHISPILLGEDFWAKYAILCQPGVRFEYNHLSIPTIPIAETDVCFTTNDTIINGLDPSLPPTFTEMLQPFRATPGDFTLPLARPDDYLITIDTTATCPRNRPLPTYSLAAEKFIQEL
ncbi:uncharacterized protein J8A68_000567 [[Candida] subhashii]|uniref:Uncharacterized protein n=1 Tax=[Candida] subhashii TaxID=561895 RepID=A0A8J5V5E1_9ASCO|nr:uncharacterized protein J8A68_000567 [[Candida] subhashii]KAG7665944.1 hypothetical protein J8A68_000567 [[Candida] subhashii]